MTRKNEYKNYLSSDIWKEHRLYALARTDGFCQFCGNFAINVHHVKYPKRFGDEHPHSLIPVCERCHNISHGIQDMKQLSNVAQMTDLSPNGSKLNYLLSGGRVYASAKSWIRALQVPAAMQVWFETGLARTAMFKKDSVVGELEMIYMDIPVYRWPAVGELLRAFDREWYQHQYKRRPKDEQKDIENFHGHYEKLINWGYDLQERALSSVLNSENQRNTPVTQETLLEAIKQAVAPRLRAHDDKLLEHDLVIAEIKEALPTMRDLDEFITVKQAITEKGFDSTIMPLYPKSKDNLSSLVGKKLKSNAVELGPKVTARLDGQQVTTEMNTYRRRDIYEALELFITNSRNEQEVNQKP